MILADVASEYSHCAYAETQCKERLIHGAYQRVHDSNVFHTTEIRQQIEAETFLRSRHEETVYRQYHHYSQQRYHHYLGYMFQSVLKTSDAYENTYADYDDHPESHDPRTCKHTCEGICNSTGIGSLELSCCSQIEIVQHPARYRRIEHHQQITACQCQISVYMPLAAWFLQSLIGLYRTLAAGSAHCELHTHDRQSQYDEEYEVKQDESSSSALTCHIRELPYVTYTYGTSRR